MQWLFLMCGIRLNEVIVQVDPYTDEEWRVRKEEIDRKRSEERAFMEGRRAAQKAWTKAHPDSQCVAGRSKLDSLERAKLDSCDRGIGR